MTADQLKSLLLDIGATRRFASPIPYSAEDFYTRLVAYGFGAEVHLGIVEEALQTLCDVKRLDSVITPSGLRYQVVPRGVEAPDGEAKPIFTSFVSEAALDGWWATVDTEIKVELFNHFYESYAAAQEEA